ncbi:MAG: cell division protein FtsZ [Brevinemataceae bacterium]
MSYFEELWSAGREENDEPENNKKNSDFIFTTPDQLQEEIFFTPRNIPENMPAPQDSISFPIPPEDNLLDNITAGGALKVLGIGGAGCNAVNRMIEDHIKGVEFIAVNTDIQVLRKSLTKNRIAIGTKITKGLGAGAKPEIGEKSALESVEEIRNSLQDTDMVFITAGMGGGTGTGAAPIIAQIAKEAGCLVVAVVTLPFVFEGSKRHKTAIEGIDKLKDHVDTMLVISNSRIFEIVEKNTSVKDAFKKIDEVLKQAVQGIAGIISETAIINVDFNDVKTILANRGEAIMGIGQAKGDNRALKAAEEALANPLIENNTFRQAGAMVAKIIGGNDFDMKEFHEAAEAIAKFCRKDAEIIMGLDFDENLKDQVRIIIVATDLIRDVSPHKLSDISSNEQPFSTLQDNLSPSLDVEQHHHASTPNQYNYLDTNDDWIFQFPNSQHPTSEKIPPASNEMSSQRHSQNRRSLDFSVRKDNQYIYEKLDPIDSRRSISDVPNITSDLDTPAFLRRKKRILNDSNLPQY